MDINRGFSGRIMIVFNFSLVSLRLCGKENSEMKAFIMFPVINIFKKYYETF